MFSKCAEVRKKTPSYNKCVKIGNWFEERALEEEMLKDYLYKRDNQLLMHQKIEKLNKELLSLVDLSSSAGGFVKYGDKVMLLNTPILNSDKEVKSLCVHVPYEVLHMHCIDANYINTPVRQVSASDFVYAPTKISTFVIRGPTAAKDNQLLRYGEPFLIYNSAEKLVLTCVKQTPLRRAENASRHNWVALVDQCGFNSHFQALPINANMRLEMEGEPVKANTRVLINHLQTNENLCMEDAVLNSVFGPVNEVACRTQVDRHALPAYKKHWCFFLDAENKNNFPIRLKPTL